MPMDKTSGLSDKKSITQSSKSPIKVYYLPWECEQIGSGAKQAGLSVVRYFKFTHMLPLNNTLA